MQEYILHPLVPRNQVHVFGGSPGAGKTTLLMQLIHDARAAWPFTWYVSSDRNWEACAELFERLGIASADHLHTISMIDEEVAAHKHNLSFQPSLEWLKSLIATAKQRPEVLIIDPAAEFLPGVDNLNNYRQVCRAMRQIAAWALEQQITIILVFHTNKTKRSEDFMNILNRISGSQALIGYASTKALLATEEEHSDGPCLVLQGQNFADLTVPLARDERGAFVLRTPLAEATERFTVLQFLPPDGSPIELPELIRLSGLHKATVCRQLLKLIESQFVKKLAHGVYALNLDKKPS